MMYQSKEILSRTSNTCLWTLIESFAFSFLTDFALSISFESNNSKRFILFSWSDTNFNAAVIANLWSFIFFILIYFRYISVPEFTKKGQFHFHLLVYDLPPELSGITKWTDTRKGRIYYTSERETRYLQGLFQRGYLDIVPATYTSRGIAGYMAKYMAKALTDTRYEVGRGYNCSRSIAKYYSAAGNTLDNYLNHFIPTDSLLQDETIEYDVPYMGRCKLRKIVKMQN